jgi:hypothetical protein
VPHTVLVEPKLWHIAVLVDAKAQVVRFSRGDVVFEVTRMVDFRKELGRAVLQFHLDSALYPSAAISTLTFIPSTTCNL